MAKTSSRKRRSSRPHGCIAKIDKLLSKDGDCLQRFIVVKGSSTLIAVATERRDASRSPPLRGGRVLRAGEVCRIKV